MAPSKVEKTSPVPETASEPSSAVPDNTRTSEPSSPTPTPEPIQAPLPDVPVPLGPPELTGNAKAFHDAEKHLSEDEAAAALTVAVDKKKKEIAEKDAADKAEAEDAEKRDATRFIVLEEGAGVIDTDDKAHKLVGWNRDRSIKFGGQNYEHVSEDAHGRWIYRRM